MIEIGSRVRVKSDAANFPDYHSGEGTVTDLDEPAGHYWVEFDGLLFLTFNWFWADEVEEIS